MSDESLCLPPAGEQPTVHTGLNILGQLVFCMGYTWKCSTCFTDRTTLHFKRTGDYEETTTD